MSDHRISVLVTRPAPFWLPAKHEKPLNGRGKGRPICGAMMLRPGANRVLRSRWEMTADHPTVAAHVQAGTLKLEAKPAEVAKHSHAPDPLVGLSDMTVAKAKPWIMGCEDLVTLERWRNAESQGKGRAGIFDLIDARMADLSESSDDFRDEG